MHSERRRLAILGAIYAVPLTVPFLLIDSLSFDLADGLYFVGLLGIPLGALLIQIRAARSALRGDAARLTLPVLRSTVAFYAGAGLVVFIAFVPLAHALGTFDIVEGTSIPGELFFLLFAAAFVIAGVITGGCVIAAAAATRRIERLRSERG